MKRITICTIGSLLALSALAAEPELDEEAQAVAAQRNQTREARMQWWRDARFGMFVHWGVYSVPAGTYRVALIYYSADDHGNTPFYVDVDGQRLTHRTRRKDSMDSSGITVDLGTATIESKKSIEVAVGPGEVDPSEHRQHMMWLYAVVLKPQADTP